MNVLMSTNSPLCLIQPSMSARFANFSSSKPPSVGASAPHSMKMRSELNGEAACRQQKPEC